MKELNTKNGYRMKYQTPIIKINFLSLETNLELSLLVQWNINSPAGFSHIYNAVSRSDRQSCPGALIERPRLIRCHECPRQGRSILFRRRLFPI